MMVKSLDAILADRTMCTPRWAIDVASGAILDLERVASQDEVMVPRRWLASVQLRPQVEMVCVVLCTRHDAWVGEGCADKERQR